MSIADNLADLGITLPLRVDPAFPGTIVDAHDRDVCVVDHNGARPDAEVTFLTDVIVSAINFYGRAE